MTEIIEKQVLEAWCNAQIAPREHQWKTCVSIISDLQTNNSQETNNTITGNTLSLSSNGKSNKKIINNNESGKNYLIQHAAGSGKSLTIACLVVQLYNLKVCS